MKKITIKVIPRSSQNKLTLLTDGTYKAKLTAPPVDGKANAALIQLVSKEFDVAKSCIHIIKGESGRTKTIEIK